MARVRRPPLPRALGARPRPELDPARTLAALGAPTAPGAPTAIPAVFFPGNGGSFRQVRSVASETARMHARRVRDRAARAEEHLLPTPPRARTPLASPPPESLRASESTRDGSGGVSPEPAPAPAPPPPPALDWFALDFGEELGAFHAASLRRQIAFASAALERILAAYPPGTHVVLLGHSMGGIVLRGVLAAREKEHARNAPASTSFFQMEKRAVTAVTLASPHGYSPAATQPAMRRLYAELEASETTRGGGAALIERGVALVSVLGGGRDWQVTPETALAARGSKEGFFFPTTFAEDVPGAPPGLSADHQCILWCNQIVRAVAAGVLDVAEEEARREAEEAEAEEGEVRSGEERTAREGGARGFLRGETETKINKKRRRPRHRVGVRVAARRGAHRAPRRRVDDAVDPGASSSPARRETKRPAAVDRVARIFCGSPARRPRASRAVRSAAVAFAFDRRPAEPRAPATTPRSVARGSVGGRVARACARAARGTRARMAGGRGGRGREGRDATGGR